MRHLRADMERQMLATTVPHGCATTGLDRYMGLPLLRKRRLDDPKRSPLDLRRVAMGKALMRNEIAGYHRVDLRRARFQRLPHVGHGGTRLELDVHPFCSVLGNI